MDTEYMLTTVDNPFDPFSQWDEWFAYDRQLGYDTPGLLARVAKVPDDASEAVEQNAIQQAIDDICTTNPTGMHRKVMKGTINQN